MKRNIALLLTLLLLLTISSAASCSEMIPITKLAISGGFDDEAMSLNLGASKGLALLILPRNASNKTLKWTSSNPQIASVTDGVIVANQLGECTITCETTDGSALKQTVDVIVESKYQAILEKVRVGHNSIGSPEVYVKVRNTGKKNNIVAFTFATKCYDAYGNLLKAHGFGDTEKSWIWQEGSIRPEKTNTDDNWCWTLYGFDTAYRIDVWLTHYRTSDGITTTINPSDYHVITWNKY
ncbi:MAG: Ig-like domain-containing protein [Bacteroidaceae bacterium]|nr:Ig-like domain-containing protein [Bacteroidaceae bacterium]